jgi:hypothetical protein
MATEFASLTIGELAGRAGIGVETVRFYEREGLLPKPPRRRSGYRQYPLDAVARVLFIRQAKELGFQLQPGHGRGQHPRSSHPHSAQERALVVPQ